MRLRSLFFALPLILAPAFALAQSIVGSYLAQGRNPDGSAYKGAVTISEKGGALHFVWQIGKSHYEGEGTRNDDVVIVTWGDPNPVYYLVMPDGELHGTWADGLALEKLVPKR